MFRKLATATLTTSLIALASPGYAATMVKEVDVSVDLDAIQNAGIASHWAQMPDDLENAIVARLTDQFVAEGEEGAKVSVDIDEAELANSLQSALGTAESKLAGSVNVTHETDNSAFDSYDLVVSFEQAGPFFLPGTDLTKITTDSKEYYDGMIAAFADHIAVKLQD